MVKLIGYFITLILFSISLCRCETVQITRFSVVTDDVYNSELGGVFGQIDLKYYFSSSSVISNDPMFPNYPNGSYTTEQYNLIAQDRLLNVVPVAGTEIIDEYFNITGLNPVIYTKQYIARTFFTSIDKNLLQNLSQWDYDGSTPPLAAAGYNSPSASGSFNQAEQRFYVSDGRQYQVVPEPSALSLLAIGLGGLAMLRRRRS